MQNTMNNKLRAAVMLGVLMGAAPLARAANASLLFVNATKSSVRVEIYSGDAHLPGNPKKPPKAEKKETIRVGGGHQFKFSSSDSNCQDKSRKFAVYMDPKDHPPSDHSKRAGAQEPPYDILLSFGEFVFEGTGSCKLRLSKLDIVQLDRHFDLFRRKASVGTKNVELLIHGPMGEPYD